MADQFSFDVVSEVNMQELKNALDQATKEIKQRFDFKDSKTEITLKEKEKELVVVSDDDYKLNAVIEIIKTKCTKRGVSLKAFDYGAVEPALSGRQAVRRHPRAHPADRGPRRCASSGTRAAASSCGVS